MNKVSLFVKLIKIFLFIPFYIILFLYFYLLRLFFNYQIITGYSSRIGHFLSFLDISYFDQQEDYKKIFINDATICNQVIYQKFQAKGFKFYNAWYLKYFVYVNALVNKFLISNDLIQSLTEKDNQGLLLNRPPLFTFNKGEEKTGKLFLRQFNLEENQYICFHNRDSAYTSKYLSNTRDWSYHNYRDFSVKDFYPTLEYFAKDYKMLRMGCITEENIKLQNNNIIDYANSNHQNDFLDLYLIAKAKFFIVGDAGIDQIAKVFRKPYCHINTPLCIESANILAQNCIFTPWLLSFNNKLLSFKELNNHTRYRDNNYFIQNNLEVIHNTPEEILDLAIEMNKRLDGTWVESKEDQEIQKQFWNLFDIDNNPVLKAYNFKIGTKFLRKYKKLLD